MHSKAAGRRSAVAALEALVEHRVADLAPFLLHQSLADEALRRAALRGLAATPNEATPKLVLAVYPKLTADEKHDAVATLASRNEYALALLDAVEAKTVPAADVSAYAARQMFALGDARVTRTAQDGLGRGPRHRAEEAEAAGPVQANPDPELPQERRPRQRPADLQQELPAVPQAVRRGRHRSAPT